jgi:hypothetical protein
MKKNKKTISTSNWNDDLFEFSCTYTFNNFKLSKVAEPNEANVILKVCYNTITKTANEDELFNYIEEVKKTANDYQNALQLIGKALTQEFVPEQMYLEINVTNSKICDKLYKLHYDLKSNQNNLLDDFFTDYEDEGYEDDFYFDDDTFLEDNVDTSHLRLITEGANDKKKKKKNDKKDK